ncbi:unnamed protein product [Fraxinus pennsylvanica]|uniref:Uncharacterized protein n=1 Tax=Fraxinus pennsylvanica TaxID=56036 RepID=A0AAD2DT92_9LAMI|nr:unnamed protein product [Fraxinus pennsylvanica]
MASTAPVLSQSPVAAPTQPSQLTSIKKLAETPNLNFIPSNYAYYNDPHETSATESQDSIPTIDISLLTSANPDKKSKAILALTKACREWGFFMVINHGIPESLMTAMLDVSNEFFNLPEEEKPKFEPKDVLEPVRYGTSFNTAKEKVFCWRDFLKVFVHPEFHCPHKPTALSAYQRGIHGSFAKVRSCIQSDLFTYNLWVSSCAATLNIDEVRRILGKMSRDSGCNESWVRYLKLVDIYITSSHLVHSAFDTLVESEKDITQRELITYDFLIILYGALKNKERLDQIWKSLRMTRQKLTGRNYVCILSSYLMVEDLKEVGDVLDQWRQSATSEFDSSTCTRLSKAFEDAGLHEKATSFRMLLSEKGCELIDEISEWMISHDEYELSDSDYAVRIDLMTKVFGIDSAERYFERLPPLAKTSETYTALLHSYARLKLIEKAEDLYERIKAANLSLSAITYNELMTLYMSVGQLEKVSLIVEELEHQNVPPDLFTYNLWVSSCAATLNIDEVRRILGKMSRDSGCNESWVRYLKLVDIYITSSHLVHSAFDSLVESEKDITQRELITYDFLIILYGALKNKERLDQIWKSLRMTRQKLTGRNYVCILSSYLMVEDLKEVGDILDQWRQSATSEFDSSTCTRLSKAFEDAGLDEKATSFRMLLSEKGELLLEYCERTQNLLRKLVRGISESLGLEEYEMEKTLNLDSSFQIFIANYYPPCPQPQLALGMPPHSDHGLLTLLIENQVGGLQIQHKGEWLNVNALPNSILVNTGDHLEIFSNGKYKSVLHKAIVNNKNTRISIAMANGPSLDTIVCPSSKLVENEGCAPAYIPMKYKDFLFSQQNNLLDGKSILDRVKIQNN